MIERRAKDDRLYAMGFTFIFFGNGVAYGFEFSHFQEIFTDETSNEALLLEWEVMMGGFCELGKQWIELRIL